MAVREKIISHIFHINHKFLPSLWQLRYLIGFKNLIRSIENIGVSAVYGINYFGRGFLSQEKYVNYIKHDVLGKDLLNSTLNYVPSLKTHYKNMTNFTEYGSIKNMWEPKWDSEYFVEIFIQNEAFITFINLEFEDIFFW